MIRASAEILKNQSAIVSSILHNPETLTLQGNRSLAAAFPSDRVTCRQLATGHLVLYGPLGRRILMTDPGGHPLHECEWREHPDGTVYLVSARFYLDWGQWVGLKPAGLVNRMTLDLTTRPGWHRLTRQDLRMMAARAMGVALEAVEFFYADDDLVIEATGHATIRQRKDALYVLDDGTFQRARFMSCMSAMHWAHIDYLPVVELFQSLLPGTGSAAFEFIRGLYDDQHRRGPRALQYRGIPTYPSEAAFGLFSNFFTATHDGQEQPFAVFMDASRSHEVDWLPHPDPPVRHVAPHHRMCLTVQRGTVLKVTGMDDTSGLPFVASNQQGHARSEKRLAVHSGRLFLDDHATSHEIVLEPGWGVTRESGSRATAHHDRSWKDLFPDGAPAVSPHEAYSATLLYPEDDTVIGDLASQPFVAEFWNDLMEHDQDLAARVEHAAHIFIHGFDAAIGTLLAGRPQSATIVYSHGAYAQKQAQRLWNQWTRNPRDGQGAYRFLGHDAVRHDVYETTYDLMYVWMPFLAYQDPAQLRAYAQRINGALRRNGLALLAGPDSLPALISGLALEIVRGDLVSDVQPFRMHKAILPRATLHPRLHAWILKHTETRSQPEALDSPLSNLVR